MGGFNAHGSTFSLGGTAVGSITNIPLPTRTKDSIDLTDHESGGDEESIPGLRRGGEFTIEGNLNPGNAGQAAILSNYEGDANEEGIITTAAHDGGTTTYTFQCHVKSINGGLPYDGKAAYSVTVKVAGAVTEATST